MAVNSMTGYGQASKQNEAGSCTIEIRTVNHRYAEVVVRSPKEFMPLEEQVRQRVKDQLVRGRIDVFLSFEPAASLQGLQLNWELLEQLRTATADIEAFGPKIVPSTALEWLQFPGVLQGKAATDVEAVRELMLDCVDAAVGQVQAMRSREGQRLAADLEHKLASMSEFIDGLQQRAPQVLELATKRMRDRMQELAEAVDETRVLTEIAVLADKIAIDEELTRLGSHLKEFAATLKGGDAIGRRLDFIIQEMNREVNTIAAKSPDMIVSKTVVDLKAVIEQMREQVQNIE